MLLKERQTVGFVPHIFLNNNNTSVNDPMFIILAKRIKHTRTHNKNKIQIYPLDSGLHHDQNT